MRQLNFRAWDTKKKKMIPDVSVYNSYNVGFYYDTGLDIYGSEEELPETQGDDWIFLIDDVEIMQFTGLKDRLGKEIYEGDILMSVQESVFIVKWIEAECRFALNCIYGTKIGLFELGAYMTPNLWVEGNIYENLELIKTPTHD